VTYKGSNWTRGELGHDVIRDPSIPCEGCDERYGYLDYWVPRYVDGRDWNPKEVCWICDACLERAREEHELHKRKESHTQLSEFAQ